MAASTLPDLHDLILRENGADGREEMRALVVLYNKIPVDSASYVEAQTRVASLNLLIGAKHEDSKNARRYYYQQAALAAERALLQFEPFRLAIAGGDSIPEAAAWLPVDRYEALLLWATAVFYHFRDVASVPERILFSGRLKRAADAIEVMMKKEPTWFGGALPFSLGIYYLSVPEVIGGDRNKARQLMNAAVEMSDKRLLARWGRAKYLAVAEADRDLFEQDLRWIIKQDLSGMEGPMIWNRYFMEDASQLLDRGDSLFAKSGGP